MRAGRAPGHPLEYTRNVALIIESRRKRRVGERGASGQRCHGPADAVGLRVFGYGVCEASPEETRCMRWVCPGLFRARGHVDASERRLLQFVVQTAKPRRRMAALSAFI